MREPTRSEVIDAGFCGSVEEYHPVIRLAEAEPPQDRWLFTHLVLVHGFVVERESHSELVEAHERVHGRMV